MNNAVTASLFQLTVAERIQLAEDLWDSVAAQPEQIELTPDLIAELDERLVSYKQHPDDVVSWDDVRQRLWQSI